MPTDFSFLQVQASNEQLEVLRREAGSDRVMLELFWRLVDSTGPQLRSAVRRLSAQVCELPEPVSVLSLMRGGVPTGFLVAHTCRARGLDVRHGLLGWLRGENAAISAWGSHARSASVVVVDGWTGSGSSIREVASRWQGTPAVTAALADPARVCDLAGTRSDMLCPHSLLQSSVSLGFSRIERRIEGLVAGGDGRSTSTMMEYCEALLGGSPINSSSKSVSKEEQVMAARAHLRPPARTSVRLGVNECWRALARGELVLLVADPSTSASPGVRLLLETFDKDIRWGSTRPYKCWGVIDSPVRDANCNYAESGCTAMKALSGGSLGSVGAS